MVRHLVDLFDLSAAEARALLDQAAELKREAKAGRRSPHLAGRTLGLLFEKPSLRTRVSFEAAIAQLGGTAIFLPGKDVGLGVRETVADFARVLSQYVDALAARTFAHATVEELAQHATIPIINALSDAAHPCQAMGDLLTIREAMGRTEGVKLVFVGDGNNVARSLAVASAYLGVSFVLSCPPGYDFPEDFRARYAAAFSGATPEVDHDPKRAVVGADVIYTDVWASMGQEDEADARREAFRPYQVDDALLDRARPDAIFLHCLPAHRGEEVTGLVLDGPRSRVIPQAANRLHFQKALLLWLLLEDRAESGREIEAKSSP
ncbi:MAG: ornithine carbamoyltransferase [Isosphaeraceae bacterium]|nr:ornithine carbamoyltransferase [Isosphaeraceae bacterium]